MSRKFGNGADLQGAQIKNVGAGSAPGDAVNFSQLTDAKRGYDLKDPVRAITLANITLSALQTIDGVSLAVGDRVLVWKQTDATKNGIYLASTGTWTRSTDADEAIEVTRGFATTVLEGTTKGTGLTQPTPMLYELTNSTDPSIGTDALNFAPVGAAGATPYTAAPGGGIIVSGSQISIDPAYSGLRTPYATTIGDASTSSFTVTHNLGTRDVAITVMDINNNYETWTVDEQRPSVNTISLVFLTPPATNQFRVLVQR